MKIWANTIVKNEERYIWFAVNSVIDYMDKMLIWDTGSSDSTYEIMKILKKIYPSKIEIREAGEVDINKYTKIRQEMLDRTKSDWLLILDGDEVWWKDSIEKVTGEIHKNGDNLDSIVNKNFNVIGDIYHYQEEKAGMYQIDERSGHLNIRAINRQIPGLHQKKPHGQHGFYDGKGVLLQDRKKERRKFIEAPYMHFTNMIRSGNLVSDRLVPKRGFKFKYEIGKSFPLDFYYPEVFFRPKPEIVPTPWIKMSISYKLRSTILTPAKMVKRRLFTGKVGY